MPARKTAAKPQSKPEGTEYGEKIDGTVSGNLTFDPEMRFTNNGIAVTTLRIADNDSYQDEDGNWVRPDEPTYITVTCWRTLAEHAAESLRKGDRITASGWFRSETYTNRDGERVTDENRFTANDLGPSLLWNDAKVVRVERSKR
jgi:single-strand DNA-binding protein